MKGLSSPAWMSWWTTSMQHQYLERRSLMPSWMVLVKSPSVFCPAMSKQSFTLMCTLGLSESLAARWHTISTQKLGEEDGKTAKILDLKIMQDHRRLRQQMFLLIRNPSLQFAVHFTKAISTRAWGLVSTSSQIHESCQAIYPSSGQNHEWWARIVRSKIAYIYSCPQIWRLVAFHSSFDDWPHDWSECLWRTISLFWTDLSTDLLQSLWVIILLLQKSLLWLKKFHAGGLVAMIFDARTSSLDEYNELIHPFSLWASTCTGLRHSHVYSKVWLPLLCAFLLWCLNIVSCYMIDCLHAIVNIL